MSLNNRGSLLLIFLLLHLVSREQILQGKVIDKTREFEFLFCMIKNYYITYYFLYI